MKVLYSRTHFWFDLKAGGSVGHTVGMLKGLSRSANVEIISNESVYGIDDLRCGVVQPVGRSWGWRGELLYNLYFAPRLVAKLKSFHPDFVYHRYNGYSIATAAVCRWLGIPLVLEFNSSDLWKIRYWHSNDELKSKLSKLIRKPILMWTEPFNVSSATLVVVVSSPLKETLMSWGIPDDRILIIPNAVNPQKFKTSPPDVCLRIKRKLGIPLRKTVVGFCSTFGEWHGIPELTEAILELNADLDRRERLFFVLYGDGKLRPMIEKEIGHFDNVRFTGTVEYANIQDYLSICDILLSPHGKTPDGQGFFGSPTKLFEYMAMAKGIVGSDLDQIGEVLEDGETAVLVEPGDVGALVQGVIFLADYPEERARLGANARRVVIEKHTWEQNASRVIQAYDRISQDGTIRK